MTTSSIAGSGGRGRRFLATVPGLLAPLILLAICVRMFVSEAQGYYALPVAIRSADGDPFSADAGMMLAAAGIAFALLLLLPPLLVGMPRRLGFWTCLAALLLQALSLFAAISVADSGSGRAWLALLLFAYVPVLALVRLVRQHRLAVPSAPQPSA